MNGTRLGLQLCDGQWEGGTRTGPRDTGQKAGQPSCDWPWLSEMGTAGPTRAGMPSGMRAGKDEKLKSEKYLRCTVGTFCLV